MVATRALSYEYRLLPQWLGERDAFPNRSLVANGIHTKPRLEQLLAGHLKEETDMKASSTTLEFLGKEARFPSKTMYS